jgi:hypothetical protein
VAKKGSRVNLTHSAWRKSTPSTSDGCVEVAFVDGHFVVRDSKDENATVLFPCAEWEALAAARAGQFDLLETGVAVSPQRGDTPQFPDGPAVISNPRARAFGYLAGATLANAMGGGILAATVHPSPSMLWALGGVLTGLEVVTGVLGLLRLKLIHEHELKKLELERRYRQEALPSPRTEEEEGDDDRS